MPMQKDKLEAAQAAAKKANAMPRLGRMMDGQIGFMTESGEFSQDMDALFAAQQEARAGVDEFHAIIMAERARATGGSEAGEED